LKPLSGKTIQSNSIPITMNTLHLLFLLFSQITLHPSQANDLSKPIIDIVKPNCQQQIFATSINNPRRIYVRASADGSSADGSTWQKAYPDLAWVLNTIARRGDTIWVAKGTYYPTKSRDRSVSFQIPSGVVLLGSFNGDENSPARRSLLFTGSNLSGDIGEELKEEDNTFHVLQFDTQDSSTLIDGFLIRNGYASNASELPYGGGLLIKGNFDNLPKMRNCVFSRNQAIDGGGVYASAPLEKPLDLDFFLVDFQFNKATRNGGALYLNSLHADSKVELVGLLFKTLRNEAGENGAGVCLYGSFKSILIRIEFHENRAQKNGGGVYINSIRNSALINLRDSKYQGNFAQNGAGVYLEVHGDNRLTKQQIEFYFSGNSENTATEDGGGIYFDLYSKGGINIQMNTDFSFNNKAKRGSVFFFKNREAQVNINSDRAWYTHNTATQNTGTGSLFTYIEEPKAGGLQPSFQARFLNSVFTENQGGAFSIMNGPESQCDTRFYNCAFWNNTGQAIVKNTYNLNSAIAYNKVSITNTILWQVGARKLDEMLKNTGLNASPLKDYFVEYSLLGTPACQGINSAACGEGNLIETNAVYATNENSNPIINLPFCSKGINAGKPLNFLGQFDFHLRPRIQQGRIDIGPTEQVGFVAEVSAIDSVRCPGAKNAQLAVKANGKSPYQYILDGKLYALQEGIGAGKNTLTVIDSVGCRREVPFDIPGKDSIRFVQQLKNASSAQANDGQIQLSNIRGGTPPYRLFWSTGDTTTSISRLKVGKYKLEIFDKNDCKQIFDFNIDLATRIQNPSLQSAQAQLYPNPIKLGSNSILDYQNLSNGTWQVQVFSLSGQLLHQQKIVLQAPTGKLEISYPWVHQGFYILGLVNDKTGEKLNLKVCVME
jgi:hypothetical protein